MAEPAEVRRFVRPDGKQVVAIVRLGEGLFSFNEESELWEEPHPAIGDGFFYWCPTVRTAGLYDSVETAEREVAAQFPWIRDVAGEAPESPG